MGGKNSGYYMRARNTNLTTDFMDLDIRQFKKKGWLENLGQRTLTWFKNNNPIGSINYKLSENEITLIYRTRKNSEEWQDVAEAIKLVSTPCNFGGERKWFECPNCTKKVLILYGGKFFRCRNCHGLVHPSVNESKLDRSSRALARYQSKLAPDLDLNALDGLDWLEKPKWMRYRTFYRMKAKGMLKQKEMCQRMIDSFGEEIL